MYGWHFWKLMPNVNDWDEARKVPDEIFLELGERGYLASLLGIHFLKLLASYWQASESPTR